MDGTIMEAIEALALVGGHVDEELLLRNEYLAAENEILRSKLGKRVPLTDSERLRLAKLGNQLGLKALKGVAAIVKPETILAWFRKLVAAKFDGSMYRKKCGRPPVDEHVEMLILAMADANPTWGYDRISGALHNLGHKVSDEAVGKILRRHGIPPAPKRKPDLPWSDFISRHQDVLAACDFFTRCVQIRRPVTPRALRFGPDLLTLGFVSDRVSADTDSGSCAFFRFFQNAISSSFSVAALGFGVGDV